MSLTDEDIKECSARYSREYDRYLKMSEVVYEKCQEIIKNLAIRATVQRRAKNPKSFADKLRKPERRSRHHSVDDVFKNISDLAGVRIATYLESDREPVVEAISKEFTGLNTPEPSIEVKDKGESQQHYRATHCQVYLPSDELTGSNENLKHTTCEIQVCSLLAHVFNEIEHDLQYKPLSGELSTAEQELIDQLGLITRSGDLAIKRLLSETDDRLSHKTGDFEDVYDFVARMRTDLNLGTKFSNNAGQLYDELMDLDIRTPDALRATICGSGEDLLQIAQREYEQLSEFEKNRPVQLLEKGSSDLLLVALLKVKHKEILKRHPTGRGRGRPSRLTQITKLYNSMVKKSNAEHAEASGIDISDVA